MTRIVNTPALARRLTRGGVAARLLGLLLGFVVLVAGTAPADASRCILLGLGPRPGPSINAPSPRVIPVASPVRPQVDQSTVLTFIGHSTFLIESPQGITIATDYNDYVRPKIVPNIVTMNRAHSTHYTDNPPPGILHVLKGWNPAGGPAEHSVVEKDVFVRNVPTNTRDLSYQTIPFGNSIFIFETGNLCIGHLGHLHHPLTPEHLNQIGKLDVVLVPVDGGYTMDVAGMVEVVRTLKARLIIPMHYFNQFTLQRFLDRVKGDFPVEMSDTATIRLTPTTLPAEPKILVLPGN
jgi:L-ascorbate metabolism protein UlaG (beta-lactamase superfamily)